jgi:hypothetical protein
MRAPLAFVGAVAVLVITGGSFANGATAGRATDVIAMTKFYETTSAKAVMIFDSSPNIDPKFGRRITNRYCVQNSITRYESAPLSGLRLWSENNTAALFSNGEVLAFPVRGKFSVDEPRNASCRQISCIANYNVATVSIRSILEWNNAARFDTQVGSLGNFESGVGVAKLPARKMCQESGCQYQTKCREEQGGSPSNQPSVGGFFS